MEQEKQPMAFLFEDVAIYKPEDIENLIDNLTEEQAKFMLIRAIQMAYKNGLYSLTESEIVSKSLRILK
jgi:predicted ATP-dependent serine protease